MVDLVKQDMTYLWSQSGDIVSPENSKIESGWAVETVPRQWWNWMQNRVDTNVAYALQKGIPEWDTTTEYIANKSYVQYLGVIYKAVATTTNVVPATNPASWVKAFAESSDALEAIKVLTPSADQLAYYTNGATAALTPLTAFARTLLDDTTAVAARATLGAQASDATLTAIAGAATGANILHYFTGTDTVGTTTLSAFGRSLIDDADAAAARTTLGVYSTTQVDGFVSSLESGKQPVDATLTAIAGLATGANQLPYFTGTDTAAQTTLTSFGRSLIDDSDAAAARTTLGLASGATTTVGTIATQNANNVNISGGVITGVSISGISDLAIADGGTGSSTAAGARTNLGLGTAAVANVQTSSTDATAGSVLTVGAFGLGATFTVNATNPNDALGTPNGMYVADGVTINSPGGLNGAGYLLHQRATQSAVQMWQPANPPVRVFHRTYASGVWSAWSEVAVTDRGHTWASSQVIDAGTNYSNWSVRRAGQSGPSNNDAAIMDVSTGSGHARFLHNNLDTAVSRGILVKRTGQMVFWGSDQAEREIFHQGNIKGTVSQAGGTPTGAIVERGSNANGEYVRFADGTQICQRAFSAMNVNEASGAIYRSSEVSWTYPAAFSSSVVSLSLGINWGAIWLQSGAGSSAVATSFRLNSQLSTTPANGPVVTAIGRWY